jgi:sec-independent protein translocase protein TatA
MFGLGFQELLVVLVIALLFFGGNKLPEVGSALGKAIREFKRATTEPSATEEKRLEPSTTQSPTVEVNRDRELPPRWPFGADPRPASLTPM